MIVMVIPRQIINKCKVNGIWREKKFLGEFNMSYAANQ